MPSVKEWAMLKKFYLLLLVLAAGCQSGVMDYETCPRVQIIRDNAYLTQVVNYREEFQINLIGYDGYCYMDRKINQNKALIKPIFQIKRLRPSDETDVHFAFYTETVKGPRTLPRTEVHWYRKMLPYTDIHAPVFLGFLRLSPPGKGVLKHRVLFLHQ